MAVGRTRKTDKHLPRRMYAKHGAFWYVDRANKWHPLGSGYAEALKRYAALQEAPAGDRIDLLIARYENEILPRRAKTTAAGRKQQFKRIRKVFGQMSPKEITGAHAWTYFSEAGQTQQARHEISALSAVLGWAVKWGALERNPWTNLRLPGFDSRKRYVTNAEFVAVRELAPPMVRNAMNLALITGLRQRDILDLERRQVAGDVLTVTASKTGKLQTFAVAGDLKATIAAALAEAPQIRRSVIATRAGKPYTTDGFQTQWQRVQKKALRLGKIVDRFTFHDLRAKSLSDAGSLEEAQKRGNHSDGRITKAVYRRLPDATPTLDISHMRKA